MTELAQVLRGLPEVKDERLLVGSATFDDAGVFRITPEMALVQTVDFFPPLVDDPRLYGQIAAANSLSDVYAMGGRPLTAMGLVCFPAGQLELEVLHQIMRGLAEKVAESGAVLVGGHSLRDNHEVKVGLSVTGTVHPARIASNAGAQPGDVLYLTKPLGMGPVSVACRQHQVADETLARAGRQMATLNKAAAEAMTTVGINGPDGVHAATDVTGYGLLGHARNIAEASRMTLTFRAAALPLIPGALELASEGVHTNMVTQNEELLKGQLEVGAGVAEGLRRLVLDSETSGGLLIAVASESADRLEAALRAQGVAEFAAVGMVEPRGKHPLRLL
jgi:selenide,water dikinase